MVYFLSVLKYILNFAFFLLFLYVFRNYAFSNMNVFLSVLNMLLLESIELTFNILLIFHKIHVFVSKNGNRFSLGSGSRGLDLVTGVDPCV